MTCGACPAPNQPSPGTFLAHPISTRHIPGTLPQIAPWMERLPIGETYPCSIIARPIAWEMTMKL